MVSEETDLDVVKQCIEMIEQEALSLMGSAPSLDEGKFEEVLSTLGGFDAVPKNSPRNLQDKLSLITKGMHLLSEQIQVKTEELKHVESAEPVASDVQMPVAEPVATAGSHKIRYDPDSPLLPPTPEQPAEHGRIPMARLPHLPEMAASREEKPNRGIDSPEASPQSQPQEAPLAASSAATFYAETLARLAQSHEDMKHRILTLEAENKRLQEEATVRSMEEQNRMAQIHTLLRDAGEPRGAAPGPRLGAFGSFAQRPLTSRSAKLKSRPEAHSTTPDRPKPPWQPAKPVARTTPPKDRPEATKAPKAPGRTTPPRPRVPAPSRGADSVPPPRAPARPHSSLRSSANLTQSMRSSVSQAPPALTTRNLSVSRSSSPPRGGAVSPRGRTLSPCRDSSGTLHRSPTPPAPSSRPSSPRRFNERELPSTWKQMVADAYCKETGRPFVDRIQLLDFTSTKKSEGSIYWVNARLRWADLRITEEGRVPKRGEVLALFVLQATPSGPGRPASEWLSNGRRAAPKKSSARAASSSGKVVRSPSLRPNVWQVASMRVLRNLPFHEQYSTVMMANIGSQLLHCALQMELPRRVTHLVRPPSWSSSYPV